MKLYVEDQLDNQKKIYLRTVAPTRRALAEELGGVAFDINGITYYVNQVSAEKGTDNTALGILVGGVIGAIGGGAGIAAGGIIGALLGKEKDKKEEIEVSQFNGSAL